MIKIEKKKWSDITLSDYDRILEIAKSEDDDLNKDVKVISLLYGLEEKEIWNLPVDDVADYKAGIAFLAEPMQANPKKCVKIHIADEDYRVCTDLSKFTYAQYVDFQTYWKKENNLPDVLTTIVVPEGKAYGEGYDIAEFREKIMNNLDIETATSICSFFLKSLVNLLKTSLQSLEKKTKMMKSLPIKKQKEERESLKEALRQVEIIRSMLGSLS